ncbi:hypothetical protein QC825_11085, partial [Larsenimonas suaedae]|nr:hypothetical protein [Larsenimonas suaedae]
MAYHSRPPGYGLPLALALALHGGILGLTLMTWPEKKPDESSNAIVNARLVQMETATDKPQRPSEAKGTAMPDAPEKQSEAPTPEKETAAPEPAETAPSDDQVDLKQAEAAAKQKAEAAAKQKAEAAAKQKAEAAAKQKAEAAAKQKAEAEAKQKAEAAAKQKAE